MSTASKEDVHKLARAAGDQISQFRNAIEKFPEMINALDEANGWTPLMHASFRNNSKIVEYLLNRGEHDLNIQSSTKGSTALIIASRQGNIDIALEFIRRGCDYELKDDAGKRAVDYRSQLITEMIAQQRRMEMKSMESSEKPSSSSLPSSSSTSSSSSSSSSSSFSSSSSSLPPMPTASVSEPEISIVDVQAELKLQRQENMELTNELSNLQQQIENEKRKAIEALAASESTYSKQLEALQSQLEQANSTISALTSQIEGLKIQQLESTTNKQSTEAINEIHLLKILLQEHIQLHSNTQQVNGLNQLESTEITIPISNTNNRHESGSIEIATTESIVGNEQQSKTQNLDIEHFDGLKISEESKEIKVQRGNHHESSSSLKIINDDDTGRSDTSGCPLLSVETSDVPCHYETNTTTHEIMSAAYIDLESQQGDEQLNIHVSKSDCSVEKIESDVDGVLKECEMHTKNDGEEHHGHYEDQVIDDDDIDISNRDKLEVESSHLANDPMDSMISIPMDDRNAAEFLVDLVDIETTPTS